MGKIKIVIYNTIKILGFPIAVCLLHLILFISGVYQQILFLDIPIHFLGGGAIAFSFIIFMKSFDITTQNKTIKIFSVVCVVGLMSILVEFMEFLIFSPYRLGLVSLIPDTIKDIFIGSLGGLVLVSLLNYKVKLKKFDRMKGEIKK